MLGITRGAIGDRASCAMIARFQRSCLVPLERSAYRSLASPQTRLMTLSGSTRVFLILGDPVVQVRAPETFNHLFRRHGVDAVMVPAEVPAGQSFGFIRAVLQARNFDGLALTIPHKSDVVSALDRCDRLGTVAGAVNAVRRGADGGLEGALFDGIGFVRALDHFGLSPRGHRVLLVGAGGAGLAIAASLAERGVAQLRVVDLAEGRAAEAVARVRATFDIDIEPGTDSDPAGFDLVVNATPLGLRPCDPLPFDVARLDAGAAVVDILMKRVPTPLLQACRARGITAHPGDEMLLQQMPDYLSFFGFDTIAQAVRDDAGELRALMQSPRAG
jgi:shikimate dehydrogenase